MAAYRRLAPAYDALFGWSLEPGRRAAVKSLNPSTGDHLLEVGIGTGLALSRWPRDLKVTGIDACPAMLARAQHLCDRREYTHVTLHSMDAQKTVFPDNHFDKISAMYVASVVPDPAAMLRELVRVGRPGARIAIINHFAHRHPLMRRIESWCNDLTRWAGWDLSLSSDFIQQTPGLHIVSERPANWFGYWTLVVAEVHKD